MRKKTFIFSLIMFVNALWTRLLRVESVLALKQRHFIGSSNQCNPGKKKNQKNYCFLTNQPSNKET